MQNPLHAHPPAVAKAITASLIIATATSLTAALIIDTIAHPHPPLWRTETTTYFIIFFATSCSVFGGRLLLDLLHGNFTQNHNDERA